MQEEARSRKFLYILLCSSYVIVFALAWLVQLNVKVGSFGWLCAATIAGAAGLIALCRWRTIRSLATLVEVNACGLLLTVPVLISTYLAFKLDLPLADQRLLSMDSAFGVNWPAMILFIDAHPVLANTLNCAYASFPLQLLFLPIILVMTGRPARAYQMVSIYGVLCFFSSLISIWFPAVGTYVMHNVDPSTLENLDGYLGTQFLNEFNAVRDNADFAFVLQNAAGIITFPSVHAAIATLSAWAAWDTKVVRYPVLVLSLLTAASAGVVANHYFVDVIAGAGVASFSIALVLFIVRMEQQRPSTSETINALAM